MSVHPAGLPVLSVNVVGWAVCLAVLVICVSAFTPHDETFRYQLLSTRRAESCSMCFGDDCWELQGDRCQYYAEVDEALDRTEPGGTAGEVDGLVHDMVGQAAASWISQECIPLVSEHTDCNKENVCVGCKSCSCDVAGMWRCEQVQRCRTDPELDVDHRIIASVMESLRIDKASRKKRSTEHETVKPTGTPRMISYQEIAEWMYGINPDFSLRHEKDHGNNETHPYIRTSEPSSNITDETDVNNIEFDEVLKNIAIDDQNYIRRKPQLNDTNYDLNDYTDLDELANVKDNETEASMNKLNTFADGIDNASAEPTVVIDLLASLKRGAHSNLNASGILDISSNIIKEENYSDDTNETIKLDAIHIMKKRDLSLISKFNLTSETTTDHNTITAKPVTGLKNNVLIPLNKIIDDKQQELKDLIKIKENLVEFIKDYNVTDLDLNETSQETHVTKTVNSTNTVLSIYNLDIFPEIQFNLRKINPNVLDKFQYKLKRDIYEVIRDVVGIKKLSKSNNISDDLKTLIRAMSFYVRKQGNVTNLQHDIKLKDDKNLRRQLLENIDTLKYNFNSTKDYLVKILELLDKDMPQSEALTPLSQTTRKIVKRVIKNHYVDDFSVIGLRVYDPGYNMTNDLRNIGNKWQLMTAKVAASAPVDKVYAMKLLHLTLSIDINKLNDALALIDFAHSRRMIPIEGSLGEELLDKINRGLKSIDKKIQIIVKYKTGQINNAKGDPITRQSKKKSFLNKIRNLLKGSKKDIVELVNQKVPRSEIVKTIAKKRLDELAQNRLTEYQETMRKWQNALNIIPRNKRSLDVSRIKNRMKNIIPKYLRGKLNPAITAKKTKKSRQNIQNQATLKKQTNNKQKKITTTNKTKTIAAKSKNAATRNITYKKRPKSVSANQNRKGIEHTHQNVRDTDIDG